MGGRIKINSTSICVLWVIALISPNFGADTDVQPHVSYTEATLNRKFIILNGQKTSLSAIYGYKRPPGGNYLTGSKVLHAIRSGTDLVISPKPNMDSMCAGGIYTDREFFSMAQYQSNWMSKSVDSPMEIAENMINFITSDDSNQYKPLLLLGTARSGKSAALARIQHLLVRETPSLWTIRVDLMENSDLNHLTLRGIIDQAVGPDFSELFFNVLETNPRRIVLLFDGIEHMTSNQASRAVQVITAVSARGAVTALTGRNHILPHLDTLPVDVFMLSEMTPQETEHFLHNIWHREVLEELPPGPSTSAIHEESGKRLLSYVQAFTHMVFEMTLPRHPVPLMILAEIFTRPSAMIWTTPSAYPATCIDYVLNPQPSAPALLAVLENVALNKYILYEKIVERLRGNLRDFGEEYGILAIAKQKLLLPIEFDGLYQRALTTVKNNMQLAIFITFKENGELVFLHQEIEDIYVAKFCLSQAVDSKLRIAVLKIIFTSSQYESVREFLNFQVPALPTKLPKSFHTRSALATITNVINGGHDNLFVYICDNSNAIFKNRERFVQTYQQVMRDESRVYNEHTDRKVLGSRVTTKPHPNPFASRRPMMSTITRDQLLVKYNMIQSLRWILAHFKDQKSIVEKNLVHVAVATPVPNIQIVKILMDFFSAEIQKADLDRLLHQAVDRVGDGCQQVVNYLVERGARPSNAVVDGSTLVHVAVRSNSVNLLRFVVEDLLNVQGNIEDLRDASGRSIFETALDANASPMYTFSGWWEMMDYLVHRLNPLPISTAVSADNPEIYRIAREDVQSAEFKLMVMNRGTIAVRGEFSDIRTLSLQPLERRRDAIQSIVWMTRFIPYSRWSFSRDTLSLRRLNWLSQLRRSGIPEISPLEMLVYFRGAATLQPAQHVHYRKTIMTLIRRHRDSVDSATKLRIYATMWNGVADRHDVMDVLYHTTVTGPDVSFQRVYDQMLDSIVQWRNNIYQPGRDNINLLTRLTETRMTYIQGFSVDPQIVSIINNFIHFINSLQYGGRSLHLLDCLNRRFRRSQSDCSFSWEDVDEFNDAKKTRAAREIRVNSDRFLQMLAKIELSDRRKARDLVRLVRELQLELKTNTFIIGNSKMLALDVLDQGSLAAYRQNRRITDITGNLWQSSASPRKYMAQLPSRTTIFYIGSQVPLMHALIAVIDACLAHRSNPTDNKCWYGAGMFGLSVLLGPIGDVAVRYTPRMIDQLSRVALELLPSKAPAFLGENIYIVRNIGLKYGARALSAGLTIVGIGFDIYNIVTMSQVITECNREPDMCTSRDKAEYIISLTFSCVSIVVTSGLVITGVGIIPAIVIQLGLMALERLALGLNDAIYYSLNHHTTFGETFRIFWRKFLGMSQPSDITALVERKNLIKYLRREVKKVLDDEASIDIVAYGIGIGSLVSGGGIVAGHGIIDMSREDIKNSETLSRVMPEADSDSIRLCLPRKDSTDGYNDYAKSVPTARYRCVNSFVLAHRKRWESGITDKSYIIYDLRYIEDGLVMGSNSVNNLFLIHNGTFSMNLMGGSGNISNNYIVHETSFRGNIVLDTLRSKNILTLASLDANSLQFTWYSNNNSGIVVVDGNAERQFLLSTSDDLRPPNLNIIGRENQVEVYRCDYTNQNHSLSDERSLVVDGKGGQSISDMDYIGDCRSSVIRPFTYFAGSDSPDVTHTMYVYFENELPLTRNFDTTHAVIYPRKSKIIVIFANQALFPRIQSVTYAFSSRSIFWYINFSQSSIMCINTQNYFRNEERVINYIFIDSYLEATIYPVIARHSHGTAETISIHNFDVFIRTNSTRFSDILSRYKRISAFKNDQLVVVTKFTHSLSGQMFLFGSQEGDQFYIEANTTFVSGGNGHDVYVLGHKSPYYTWIDNHADDRALDTLILSNATCDSLSVNRGSLSLDGEESQAHDVTIFCSPSADAPYSGKNVILRKYLFSSAYRHLQIFWDNAVYVLLPAQWTREAAGDTAAGTHIELGLFYSFDKDEHLDVLTLTSRNSRYLVFNVTEGEDSLLAYRSPQAKNVIITKKSETRQSMSFVVLENFFSSDNDSTSISTDWEQVKIFVTTHVDDSKAVPTVLTAENVNTLIISTAFEDVYRKTVIKSYSTEYLVNLETSDGKTVVIQHNNGTDSDKFNRLGILMVTGAKLEDFRAQSSANYSNSLSLCTQRSCIVVKNWCLSPRHRLYRMEFSSAVNQRPTVIRDLDELDCQPDSLEKLNGKLKIAQQQLALTAEPDESDRARLIRCVASVFVTSLPFNVTYKFFEFQSMIDYVSFIQNNCHTLFTRTNLKQLSMKTVRKSVEVAATKYELNILNSQEQRAIGKLRKFLGMMKNSCWRDFNQFLYSLYDNEKTGASGRLKTTFKKFNEISVALVNCVTS